MSKPLAGLILFLVVGGTLVFISGDPRGAMLSQTLIGTAIAVLILSDASDLQKQSNSLLAVFGQQPTSKLGSPTSSQ